MSPSLPVVRLVVPLGPNPAALTESAWALCAQGHRIDAVVVVLESEEAEMWLYSEVLGEWGAWEDLHAQYPLQVPAVSAVTVRLAGGMRPDTERFAAVLFEEVLRLQSDNVDVVVTLSGGRWRGSTAIATTIFQLLARWKDRVVDVRLDEPMAEGATGFYFPTQSQQKVLGKGGSTAFLARQVSIDLQPMRIPKLRQFLTANDLKDYTTALQASEKAIQDAIPPRLKLDIAARKMWVNDVPISVPKSAWPYYVRVVMARKRGEPGVQFSDLEGIKTFLATWKKQPGYPEHGFLSGLPKNNYFRDLAGSGADKLIEAMEHPDMRKLYRQALSKYSTKVQDAVTAAEMSVDWLIPHKRNVLHAGQKRTIHAIKLDAELIELVGDIQLF